MDGTNRQTAYYNAFKNAKAHLQGLNSEIESLTKRHIALLSALKALETVVTQGTKQADRQGNTSAVVEINHPVRILGHIRVGCRSSPFLSHTFTVWTRPTRSSDESISQSAVEIVCQPQTAADVLPSKEIEASVGGSQEILDIIHANDLIQKSMPNSLKCRRHPTWMPRERMMSVEVRPPGSKASVGPQHRQAAPETPFVFRTTR